MSPRAPKACGRTGCEARVTARTYCPAHQAEHTARSTWGRGSTRSSRAMRATVLRLHPHCYLRFEGCTITSTEDDHVVPLSQGGTDHISNHNGACHHCHDIKSRREATDARRAHRAEGKHPREQHPGLV